MAADVVVIDNYDSFVYNLVQYLGELGAAPTVFRHDEITVDELAARQPDGILISPGPGNPDEAGISNAVIEQLGPTIPILGVCLGHQCIGQVFGGRIVRAPTIMHGKTSWVRPRGRRRVRRPRRPVRSDPLPLARDRPGDGARRARGHRSRPTTA